MTISVKRGKDGLPLGSWEPFRTVAWVTLAALLLAFWSPLFGAEMRFTNADVDIVLLDTPCANQTVLSIIVPASREFYQDGTVTVPGRTVPLCWRVPPDRKEVWVVDEEGEAVRIPIAVFAPKETI